MHPRTQKMHTHMSAAAGEVDLSRQEDVPPNVYRDALRKEPQSKLGQLLASSVSENTWALRRRMAAFEGKTLAQVMEMRMTQVSSTTVAKEMGQLAWLADRELFSMSSLDRKILDDTKTAVRKTPHVLMKALPMTREWVQSLTGPKHNGLSDSSKALVQMSFLSASRVEDCLGLTPAALRTMLTDTSTVFGATKTNAAATARPDHHTTVKVTKGSALYEWVHKGNRFTDKHHATLERELAKIKVPQQYVQFWAEKAEVAGDKVRDHFTLHSMKRGAAYYLWRAVARREITLDQLKAQLKHEDLKSSLEYAPDRALVAKAMSGHTVLHMTMPTMC